MDVKMNRVEENKVNLEIQVGPQQVEQALDGAYRRLAQRVKVPGFRAGKVPRNVLEMRLGEEALMEEALETLLPKAYSQAVQEAEIKPVSQPEVSDVKFGDDRSVSFSATVEIRPEVQLGTYRGLTVPPDKVEVSEEAVEQRLQQLQQQVASWRAEEKEPAQEGDLVVVDLVVELEGEQQPDLQAEGQAVVLGSGGHWPELEEGLQGAQVGDERRIQVQWPEDSEPQELAGKDVLLVATVQEVKRQQLPDIDDEFAKDVGDFSTLDELKADIRQRLEQAEKQRVEEARKSRVVEQAAANAEVALPPSMVKRRQETLQRQLEERIQQYGLDMDSYLEYTGRNTEGYQKEMEESAQKSLKQELVLEAIARAEGMEVSATDIEEELASTAKVLAVQEEKGEEEVLADLRQQGYADIIEESLLRRKAVDFLLAKAQEEEVAADEEAEAEDDASDEADGSAVE